MAEDTRPPAWKIVLAFAIIYFVWGSTYLAIRIGVQQIPPLLLASMRFFVAGLVLYGWVVLRGQQTPSRRQWLSILLLAALYFLLDYGLLFWAEQRVPSGPAAVTMATIPLFIALAEILLLRSSKLTLRLALALLIGMAGVAVLVSRSLHLGGTPLDTMGVAAMILGALSWGIGSVLARKLPLPQSKAISSGAQMLAGGVMLAVAGAAFGELHDLHLAAVSPAAWLSLLYLIVPGSIIGFTAYVWLLHHESPTKVGTYAYVNPIVAVVLGYLFDGEPLGPRTILGTLSVLVSVVLITTTPKPSARRQA